MRNVKEINLESGGTVYNPGVVLLNGDGETEVMPTAAVLDNVGTDVVIEFTQNLSPAQPAPGEQKISLKKRFSIAIKKRQITYVNDGIASNFPQSPKQVNDGYVLTNNDLIDLQPTSSEYTFLGWTCNNKPITVGFVVKENLVLHPTWKMNENQPSIIINSVETVESWYGVKPHVTIINKKKYRTCLVHC